MERIKLLIGGFAKLIMGIIAIALLLFLPAGTIHFPNAWLFSGLLFIPMIIVGVVLFFKSPELLKKRLNSKETQSEQKSLIIWSSVIFVAMFLLAGLTSVSDGFCFPSGR